MSEGPYRPIACSIHDRLEAAAVRGTRCRLRWRDAGGAEVEREVRVRDVFAEGGAEWLVLEDGARVRLDRLVRVEGLPVPRESGP